MVGTNLRETIFANQKSSAFIPQNAELTPWPKDSPEGMGSAFGRREEAVHRQADVYAAYLAYTDQQIGA